MGAMPHMMRECLQGQRKGIPVGTFFLCLLYIWVYIWVSNRCNTYGAISNSQFAHYINKSRSTHAPQSRMTIVGYSPRMMKLARTAKNRKALISTGPRTWSVQEL